MPPAFLERLAAAPLLYQPGTVWDYGLSIDVIGLVVEALSGQSLGAFLEQRLFRPLGMVDTGFQVPPDKVARLARPLPRDPDTGAAQSVPDRAQALRFECGGGGLASTALDYLRFAQMLLGGGVLGETRILGRKTVEAMRTNRLTPDIENRIAELDPNSEGYGFGLTVAVRERASTLMGSPGEFYWNGAYGTLWWADPAEDLAVVFMAQVPGEQRQALPAADQCAGLPGVGGIARGEAAAASLCRNIEASREIASALVRSPAWAGATTGATSVPTRPHRIAQACRLKRPYGGITMRIWFYGGQHAR